MTRREEREQAFLLIFERNFHNEPFPELIENALEARDFDASDFAKKIVSGVDEHQPFIDDLIEKKAVGWRKTRISKVAFSVLQLAIYEIYFEEDIPVGVSINEAVELAKKFASEEDASFVNGILGNIAKATESLS